MMLLSFFLLITVLSSCNGTTKTWIPNTNYGTKENWSLKRIPCRTDQVVFPATSDSDNAVFLRAGNTAMRELILPETGELILPDGQLLVTGANPRSSSVCPGETLMFIGSERLWVDANNWQDAIATRLPEGSQSPVPHVERLPCATDQIVFPDASSFNVRLPEVPVSVGEVYIEGRTTTNREMQNILAADTGYFLFKGSEIGSVEVTGDTCSDPMGCVCRHSDDEVVDVICNFESTRCEDTMCENPITPTLHCCKICGAVLKLGIDGNRFSSEAVKAKLSKYTSVLWHLSRTDDFEMQVVIREPGVYTGESADIAKKLAAEILNDRSTGIFYVKQELSGETITTLGSTGSVILLIVFFIILMLGVVALVVFGYQRYRTGIFPTEMPSFHFRRFENASAPGEGEVEIARRASEGKSFDNPMFDQPSTSSAGFMSALSGKFSGSRSVTMENPTFKALQAAHEGTSRQGPDENDTSGSTKYQTFHDEE